ncbi:unnamed protein product [marine sediment metagenome]|uniref:Uncharacterized protein n=1 Tax=marine sediment metagenome TaxID=412755 RepID=X1RR96_9ZZZZ
MKRPITIRLEDDVIEVLDALGGKTKGIRHLVKEHLKKIRGEKRDKTPEEVFYESIYLPSEPHLREVYIAFVMLYLKCGGRSGSLDHYIDKLSGSTGLDQKTIVKNIRKLANSGFVTTKGFLFRPTLRLKETVNEEEFREILNNYLSFIRNVQRYRDWLEK